MGSPDTSLTWGAVRPEITPSFLRPPLDTDERRFGGQGRIASDQVFESCPRVENRVQRDYLHLYLPARTAAVLRRE